MGGGASSSAVNSSDDGGPTNVQNGNKFKESIVLLGPGASGKSTVRYQLSSFFSCNNANKNGTLLMTPEEKLSHLNTMIKSLLTMTLDMYESMLDYDADDASSERQGAAFNSTCNNGSTSTSTLITALEKDHDIADAFEIVSEISAKGSYQIHSLPTKKRERKSHISNRESFRLAAMSVTQDPLKIPVFKKLWKKKEKSGAHDHKHLREALSTLWLGDDSSTEMLYDLIPRLLQNEQRPSHNVDMLLRNAKQCQQHLSSIFDSNFNFDDATIVSIYSPTTTMNTSTVQINGQQYGLIDHGGQLHFRAESDVAIKHCKDEGQCTIVFVVSLTDYTYEEGRDRKQNRLENSLQMWEDLLQNDTAKGVPIILLLNKEDEFRETLPLSPLSCCAALRHVEAQLQNETIANYCERCLEEIKMVPAPTAHYLAQSTFMKTAAAPQPLFSFSERVWDQLSVAGR